MRALACLVLLAGCSRTQAPEWVRLAPRFAPGEVRREAAEGEGAVRLLPAAERGVLVTTIEAGDWRPDPAQPGVFETPLRTRTGLPRAGEGWRPELALGGRTLEPGRGDEPGHFSIAAGRVRLVLEPGAPAPGTARLSQPLPRGTRGDAGTWRISEGRRFAGDALALWPGERWETELGPGAARTLRFATAHEPALTGRGHGELVFRVRVDGAPAFEHRVEAAGEPTCAWHAVPLPDGACRLRFEVDGPPAHSAFFAPVVGPREVGTFGERPWKEERPDLVVFLADTFRADNLGSYGSELGLTPNLDALAAESLVFRRTWSTGTFTLPAHATMFSGLFPHQVGIVGRERALPGETRTIAEALVAAGYRTGAITDGLIVSQKYGLDQGFEWFDESLPAEDVARPLDSTFERLRGFLDADDGRPLLLFVQTYRTHIPYRVSEETRARHGEALGLRGSFAAFHEELEAFRRNPDPTRRDLARRDRLFELLRAHYLGGVADLDLRFPEFQDELERRGLLDSGRLVFTSDHGEGFGEHGVLYHMDKVWEELVRVPLLIHGRGIEPGVVEHAASLIDLAPTLAALAGLAPEPGWLGRPLLELDEDRPVFAFECRPREQSTLAIVDGDRKAIGYEDPARLAAGELLGAYRLDLDPGETHDLAGVEAWPGELCARLGPAAHALLVPRFGEEAADLSEESLEELRAMGYVGE